MPPPVIAAQGQRTMKHKSVSGNIVMIEHSNIRIIEVAMVYTVPVSGLIEENAYFYIDEKSGAGFVIDPGSEPDKLIALVRQKGWKIEKILITHGHFDHIGGAGKMRAELGCEIVSHPTPEDYMGNAYMNLSYYHGFTIELDDVQGVNDGSVVSLKANPDFSLRVIETPGHTTDSVIYYSEKDNLAFVGDTVFRGSVGRWDLPGGDLETLRKSIVKKVFSLPGKTVLYSGHSEPTTVNEEAERNAISFL